MHAMDGRMMDGRELRVQLARYGRPDDPPRRSGRSSRRRRYTRHPFNMLVMVGFVVHAVCSVHQLLFGSFVLFQVNTHHQLSLVAVECINCYDCNVI